MSNKEQERIIGISNQLKEAANSVRILRNIAWPNETKTAFFKNNAAKLPVVEYANYDPSGVIDLLKSIRKKIGKEDEIDLWAGRIADKIETSARLLAARGTEDFYTYSEILYGKPAHSFPESNSSTLDLANHFSHLFEKVKYNDLGAPAEACVLASALASEMKAVVEENFKELAPEIVLDDTLASNVLAGRQRISIRPNACFTDNDVQQLIEHEIHVHVASSLNGFAQPYISILSEGHAGTTKTQEGLAVFAEFISGSIDLDRVRRLSDRVIAIQMAVDGANFIEVYRYFLEKTGSEEQSFENAKRVFRGGLIKGKAPFTKDIVYLEGLLSIHHFLHVAIRSGKLEYLDLLFTGKLDIEDLPAIKQLNDMGLIQAPRFLPPWLKDKRHLLTYLSYSSFLNNSKISRPHLNYERIFE